MADARAAFTPLPGSSLAPGVGSSDLSCKTDPTDLSLPSALAGLPEALSLAPWDRHGAHLVPLLPALSRQHAHPTTATMAQQCPCSKPCT